MMMTTPKLWAIIPAAGTGRRFSATSLKQYQKIDGKTVLEHSVNALYQLPLAGCVIAVADQDQFAKTIHFDHPVQFCRGGKERMDSVLSALFHLQDQVAENDYVLVHDAARPCLHPQQIELIEEFCKTDQTAAILAVPVRDTLKRATPVQYVEITVNRERLWQAQTPQIVKYQALYDTLVQMSEKRMVVTDESSALEYFHTPVQIIQGRADNIKITYPEDLALAEMILKSFKKPKPPSFF